MGRSRASLLITSGVVPTSLYTTHAEDTWTRLIPPSQFSVTGSLVYHINISTVSEERTHAQRRRREPRVSRTRTVVFVTTGGWTPGLQSINEPAAGFTISGRSGSHLHSGFSLEQDSHLNGTLTLTGLSLEQDFH